MRGVLCWIAAIALVCAGFLIPLILVAWVVYSVVFAAIGAHNDASDTGTAILALMVGAVAGLLAGGVGMLITSFPALALIGKSGY